MFANMHASQPVAYLDIEPVIRPIAIIMGLNHVLAQGPTNVLDASMA
jgi:hypothetical protein